MLTQSDKNNQNALMLKTFLKTAAFLATLEMIRQFIQSMDCMMLAHNGNNMPILTASLLFLSVPFFILLTAISVLSVKVGKSNNESHEERRFSTQAIVISSGIFACIFISLMLLIMIITGHNIAYAVTSNKDILHIIYNFNILMLLYYVSESMVLAMIVALTNRGDQVFLLISMLIAVIFRICISYVFIFYSTIPDYYAPALSCTLYSIFCLSLFAYRLRQDIFHTSFDKTKIISNIKYAFYIGMPYGIFAGCETLAYCRYFSYAGASGMVGTTAFSIVIKPISILYALFAGFSRAAMIYLGQYIDCKNLKQVNFVLKISFLSCSIICALFSIVMILLNQYILYIYNIYFGDIYYNIASATVRLGAFVVIMTMCQTMLLAYLAAFGANKIASYMSLLGPLVGIFACVLANKYLYYVPLRLISGPLISSCTVSIITMMIFIIVYNRYKKYLL